MRTVSHTWLGVTLAAGLLGACHLDGGGGGDNPDPFPDECSTRNSCGGCRSLLAEPGASCGTCGHFRCDPDRENVSCDFVMANTCGGCDDDRNVGDTCGACGTGTLSCDWTANKFICTGDLGASVQNACGGCQTLEGDPGSACGACSMGKYVCSSDEAVTCQITAEQEAQCAKCQTSEGTACGTCGTGHLVCDETGKGVCDGDQGKSILNACGGCGALEAEPGTSCGSCGLDKYECDGHGSVVCNGDTANDCGGCDGSTQKVGTDCGVCGAGKWDCGVNNALVCNGDNTNACGGCSALTGKPGDACGVCGLDHLMCDGTENLRCSGDTAKNTCGGCGTLAHAVGDSCDGDDADFCQDDKYACQGKEAVSCTVGENTCEPTTCDNLNVTVKTDAEVKTLAEQGCGSLGILEVTGDVTSLVGLEHLALVNVLKIHQLPNLHSLAGLDGLTSAQEVTVYDVPLTNFQGLSKLENAHGLNVTSMPALTSLEGLSALTSVLNGITLQSLPELVSLEGLSALQSTYSLDLRNAPKLRDLKGLGKVQTLTALILGGSAGSRPSPDGGGALESLAGLDSLTKIWNLAIEGQTKLKNVDALSNVQLQSVKLARNPALESFVVPSPFIPDSRQLNDLIVRDCPALTRISLPGFSGNVVNVWLENSAVLSAVELGNAYHLRNLVLTGLPLLTAVPVHPTSIYLSLKLNDLPALANLDALVDLSEVTFTVELSKLPKVTNLGGFGSLTKIGDSVTINEVGTVDLNGFSNLTHTSSIRLTKNPALHDLRGLETLQSLTGLTISDNPQLPTCRARALATHLHDTGALTVDPVISGNSASNDCL